MGKRILVVDDQEAVVDVLSRFLSKEGFEVLTATDGESALKLAKKSVPDLILLDVMMPGMDGGAILERMREDDKLKYVRVIFLTGAISDEETVARNERTTGELFMSKAGDIRTQIKYIKELLMTKAPGDSHA